MLFDVREGVTGKNGNIMTRRIQEIEDTDGEAKDEENPVGKEDGGRRLCFDKNGSIRTKTIVKGIRRAHYI